MKVLAFLLRKPDQLESLCREKSIFVKANRFKQNRPLTIFLHAFTLFLFHVRCDLITFALRQTNTMRIFFIPVLFLLNCYTSKDNVDKSFLIPLMKSNTQTIQVNIIGDSLSERSNAFGLQNKLGVNYKVNDFSIIGKTVYDWLFDISRPFNPVPDLIIIELGTNDVMMGANYDFAFNLNRLNEEIKLRSSAKIILTAIPLTDDFGLHERIKINNAYVRSLSNLYTITDLEKVFEDNRSNLRLYPSYDPIHPNPVGYELIGEIYKKEILLNVR